MGKSYHRHHFNLPYDPKDAPRYMKKTNFGDCNKHGQNLIVKRGIKPPIKSIDLCDEVTDFKLTSRKTIMTEIKNYEIKTLNEFDQYQEDEIGINELKEDGMLLR